jgi:hypothetical protein
MGPIRDTLNTLPNESDNNCNKPQRKPTFEEIQRLKVDLLRKAALSFQLKSLHDEIEDLESSK